MTPEEMLARLLYRDGLMLVIDKPVGMAVHRGPKGGESLEDHFDALRFGLPRAPALAHRLDRDTAGCLVLGRHRKALATLGRLFKNGLVGKTYWAVVEGGPESEEGRIDLPLGRRDETRGWWMKPDPKGPPAVTTWRVLGRADVSVTSLLAGEVDRRNAGRETSHTAADGFTTPPPSPALPQTGGGRLCWLALDPVTGRTHQLRVHCAEMGWPIVGDHIYGRAPRTGGPILHLQSRKIVVPIYKNKPAIAVTAPVPEHMRVRLKACGWEDAAAPFPGTTG
jgi:tRNA pseudouridine32 synthase / 23S rRNA pseudouridine746 synthase